MNQEVSRSDAQSNHPSNKRKRLNISFPEKGTETNVKAKLNSLPEKEEKSEKSTKYEDTNLSIQATTSGTMTELDPWFRLEEQQIVNILRNVHICHERRLRRAMAISGGAPMHYDESLDSEPLDNSFSSESSDEDNIIVLVSSSPTPPILSTETEDAPREII